MKLFGKSKVERIEEHARIKGYGPSYPIWFRKLQRLINIFMFLLILSIPTIVFLFTGSSEGSSALLGIIIIPLVGLVVLLFKVPAYIQGKLAFSKELPANLRKEYKEAYLEKAKELVMLFVLVAFLTTVLIVAMLFMST